MTSDKPLPRKPDKRLTVGCIGAGDIVRATHLPVLKAISEIEVAWVTDINEGRAKEMARVYDVPFRPLPQGLQNLPHADVYLLACPFGVRDPYYPVLRDRSACVYVEKPFARTSQRHAELCSWFPDYALASGLMMRCWGPNLMVRSILQQQPFGRLKAIRFGFGKPGLVTQGNYYFESKRGGAGMISEVGIHGIDAALFVSGATQARIVSSNVILEDDLDLHAEARFQAQTAEGHDFGFEFVISTLQSTIDGMEIECEHATLSYPLPGQGYALIAESPSMEVSVQPKFGGSTYTIGPEYVALHPMTKFQMFHKYWMTFLGGVCNKAANSACAARAHLTTEVIESCYGHDRDKVEGKQLA